MTSSTYNVEVEKKHYVFESLINLNVSPSEGTILPDIKIKAVDLCGGLQITHPPTGISATKERLVVLKSGNTELQRK